MGAIKFIKTFWRSFVIFLTPLLLLPLIVIINTKESRCGFVIALMGIYWMTEAVPMAVTALIPVFAFPLLGVVTTDDICYVYMKETNMMFIGGLIIAIAVEHCNLHKRIALFVILHMGQSPLQLMAGFMVTTMFLSMWISNTASTAMMVPIVDAILQEFYKTYGKTMKNKQEIKAISEDEPKATTESDGQPEKGIESDNIIALKNLNTSEKDLEKSFEDDEEEVEIIVEATSLTATPPNENCRAFRDMFFLATAYGANLGGTGSYTGSGTNLVLKGVLRSLFSEPTDLNFASWMMFCIPCMLICGILVFTWLQFYFLGIGKSRKLQASTPEKKRIIRKMIQKKYDELGSITFHEYVVLFWFVTIVLLWFFLAPGFITGWGDRIKQLFGEEVSVDDATPVMLVVFILFVLPSKPNFLCFRNPDVEDHPTSSPGCLTWRTVQAKLPWGIVLLMGSGFAMAKAAQDSGLSLWMGEQLRFFEFLSPEVLLLFICIMTALFTEITSNAATAAVLLPVLKDLSLALCINPLFLMLPATLCCSFAFMLPVATPPNALVYGAANIDSKVMIKAGLVPNIICVLVVTLVINVLGEPILRTGEMPPWTNSSTNGLIVYC